MNANFIGALVGSVLFASVPTMLSTEMIYGHNQRLCEQAHQRMDSLAFRDCLKKGGSDRNTYAFPIWLFWSATFMGIWWKLRDKADA